MWNAVVPCDVENSSPSSRFKHTATLVGQHIYILGGRNGNLPLKDFWRYNLVTGKWQQLHPSGVKLPSLQEHTAVTYKDNIYVFGGEIAFLSESETPLWIYDIKNNSWKKVRTQKGAVTPKGRRGHTAVIHKGTMIIYGGYQDLRGSSSELWVYHFESQSWHLVSTSSKLNPDVSPQARHKHSAVLHNDAMWVYGGMTDLQERSDLWKWDTISKTWTCIKTKQNPGQLHSHAACRLPSSMILFGGEHDGHPVNDLWRFSFNTELWEKVTINGIKPQPRAEAITITVPQILLNDPSSNSLEAGNTRTRARTCNLTEHRHSSYTPNNRITSEKTYVFKPSVTNYVDGSELIQQHPNNGERLLNNKGSFLQEISKLSNLNIPKFNNKCSYTVLSGCTTESTESLLKQYATPQGTEGDCQHKETTTPVRGTLVKSKSAYAVKRKEMRDISPNATETDKTGTGSKNQRHVEFATGTIKIPRDPISVPNFSLITLPTPSLTPVEAAQLVFVDSDDESYADDVFVPPVINNITQYNTNNSPKDLTIYENFKVVKRGESYSSHLAYADNPLYQHMIKSSKSDDQCVNDKTSNENISATSDYASLETVNRLSSTSSYSGKNTHEIGEVSGPFGFCNPNYLGPDINGLSGDETSRKREVYKLLNPHDKIQSDQTSSKKKIKESLELQTYNGVFDRNTKVLYRNSTRHAPPRFLAISNSGTNAKPIKHRASSASRAEKNINRVEPSQVDTHSDSPLKGHVSFYIFVVGGKEHGQVTVFKRPLSIWRLNLF